MSNCQPSPNNFFGPSQQHIKLYNGTFVAVSGANMTHKLNGMPNIRIPYQQVVTSKIVLRPGQTNYLLNFLGLGDNATFLAITATYDERSKFTNDNFVQYSYYSDRTRTFSFTQVLVLTGNAENRVEQLYLTNPNQSAGVILEVMVGVIDEYSNYFQENPSPITPSIPTISGLTSANILLWEEDNTILTVTNSFGQNALFMSLGDINSITPNGSILTIDDTSVGQIILIFNDEVNATQARIKINGFIDAYLNGTLNPPLDDYEPVITFTSNVLDDDSQVMPHTSLDGDRAFLGEPMTLGDYGSPSTITKTVLSLYTITEVRAFNNDIINITPATAIIIKDEDGTIYSDITETGEYYIFYNISDDFGNRVSELVNVKINVV